MLQSSSTLDDSFFAADSELLIETSESVMTGLRLVTRSNVPASLVERNVLSLLEQVSLTLSAMTAAQGKETRSCAVPAREGRLIEESSQGKFQSIIDRELIQILTSSEPSP